MFFFIKLSNKHQVQKDSKTEAIDTVYSVHFANISQDKKQDLPGKKR
jgi:hypothetical protein